LGVLVFLGKNCKYIHKNIIPIKYSSETVGGGDLVQSRLLLFSCLCTINLKKNPVCSVCCHHLQVFFTSFSTLLHLNLLLILLSF